MTDPRDFQALCDFAGPAAVLIGLGLIGCLLHREPVRIGVSILIALIGCVLLLQGAAGLHQTAAFGRLSLGLPVVGLLLVLIAVRRR